MSWFQTSARRTLAIGGATAVVLSARPAAAVQRPAEIVDRGLRAMGGEAAVRALANTTVDYYSVTWQLGQEETPGSPPRGTVTTGRIVTDLTGQRRASQLEQRGPTGALTRQRRVVANGIGLIDNNNAQSADNAAGVAGVERAIRLLPERLVLSAFENPGALRPLPGQRWRDRRTDAVRYVDGPDTLAMYFDRENGLLLAVQQIADDPVLGDRRTTTWYTRWQNAGGVLFPRQIDVDVNGRAQSHMIVTAVATNTRLDEATFAMPDSIRARAQAAPPPATALIVHLVELAPGVWRAEGGSHHSLVIEQPDRLVVVEAPLNAARSRAVLDTLRSRFPAKRVGAVVMTHHHWDHSGGIRAYIARAVPVVAHARNAAFVHEMATARKTAAPDGLVRGRIPSVLAVNDSLTLGQGDSRVVLYALSSTHAEGILAAYVPAARLLFTSDVLSPGPVLAPLGSRELVALVRDRGINVDRFAGGHGGVANWADVLAAAR
jgi:glyoxylase-like metal-dependent hydrolase (beta-lactamase superfamily II)